MLSLLTDFVEELREAGVPVSMVETIDATEALGVVELADRAALKTALGATLVKSARRLEAFDTAFEVFFALDRPPPPPEDRADAARTGAGGGESSPDGSSGGGGSLTEALAAALAAGNWEALGRLVRQAVEELAGMTSGRPVGGAYYLYRTLRRLDLDLLRELVEEMSELARFPSRSGRRRAGGPAPHRGDRRPGRAVETGTDGRDPPPPGGGPGAGPGGGHPPGAAPGRS